MPSIGSRVASRSFRHPFHVRSVLSKAIVGALLLGSAIPAAMAQDAYRETGRIGDAASWRSEEFVADWGLGAIGAEYAYARGLSGKGVRLGVFDSGVDLRHGEFSGKANVGLRIADTLEDGSSCSNGQAINGSGACFVSDGDTVAIDYFHYTDDDRALVEYLVEIGYLYDWVPEYLESIAGFQYGTHGTHVAGSMLANRDSRGTHGVGYGASLTTSRLFSHNYTDLYSLLGAGGESYAIGPDGSAVASMYAQMAAQGARAINHSWGLSREPTTAEDMDALYHEEGAPEYFTTYTGPSLQGGLLQVWAAGNGDGDIAGIYATLPRWNPELEKYWLSVVNINDTGVIDESSSICGLSKDWCVTAPGTDIASTVVGGEIEGEVVRDGDGEFVGFDIVSENPEYGYGDMTGTSMAAPHVTGALALLMERYPYLDNAQVRDVLLTTAADLGEAGVDEVYGWGLIDLEKAIDGPGQIRVDTDVVMNRMAGGAKVWEGLAWDDWRNDLGGDGRLSKSGVGWLRLSGDNSFGGLSVRQGVLELDGANALKSDVQVDGGVLLLDGSLDNDLHVNAGQAVVDGKQTGSTWVHVGGRLSGSGTLAATTVEGTIAPGNSIGTLTVAGDYVQAAGSVYEAELGAGGQSDRLQVEGLAQLQGGTLRLSQYGPGEINLGERYDLLSAAGVDGEFAAIDRSAFSPFLAFDLNYTATGLGMDVVRGQQLATAARTFNQRSVAAAADALVLDSELARSLTRLFPEQALPALDSLSGELHASTHAVLVDGSRHVRDAALARAQAGSGAFAPAEGGVASAAWIEVFANGGTVHADGNAGEVDYNGRTTLLGYDYRFGNGWRIGALGGAGRDDMKLPSRRSEGDIRSRHVGLYVGQSWGGFGLRAGLGYARHDVEVDRTVAFADVDDRTRADYDADTRQAYVEGGYRFGFDVWELEPFAQFAQVRVESDRIAETGGAAALAGEVGDTRVNLSTLGLRFNLNLKSEQQDESWLSLRGAIGYRHASGDLAPGASLAWAGATAFEVHGATLAEDATVVEAGLGARLGRNGLLELGYSGQLADEARDHGVNARYSISF